MKNFHLTQHSRSIFSRIGVVPAHQNIKIKSGGGGGGLGPGLRGAVLQLRSCSSSESVDSGI